MTNDQRSHQLKAMTSLNYEQRLEQILIDLKQEVSSKAYDQFIDDYLTLLDRQLLTFALYDYQALVNMGYPLAEIVEKTVSLSAAAITGYQVQAQEQQYWMAHRRNNMTLYVCAMHAGIMLGHFSITPVVASEAVAFLQGKRAETQFTVLAQPAGNDYYLYISAVVVRPQFRDSAVATRLIRQGHRLIMQHLASHPLAKGYFAEAYSDAGRRLCTMLAMDSIGDNFYVKEYQARAASL